MKKSSIGKIVAIAVTLVILLMIVVLLRAKTAPVPEFNFLKDKTLIARIEVEKNGYRISRFAYSYEADFNNIVADANSELSALGYINNARIDPYYPSVKYYIPGTQASLMENSVQIVKNCTLQIISTRDGSNLIFPDQYISLGKVGWIKVEIVQSKKKNWLIAKINYIFNKLRGLE